MNFLWQFPAPIATGTYSRIGVIKTIPEQHYHALQFIFVPINEHKLIWLSWYYPPPVHLHVGDIWQLTIHTKITNKNWLLAERINGTGTIINKISNQIIGSHAFRFPISHLRETIYQKLINTLLDNTYVGFICALTVGIRDRITEIQWQDLRGTGTNHLMAIAGLHIGFIASMIYSLINYVWRCFPNLMLKLPAQEAAMIGALIAAIFYSALAGFALPTQRAIIMFSTFLLTTLWRKHITVWTTWRIALVIILMLEPLAILTPSFWLSFGAVALIIYGHSARIHPKGLWWRWAQAQWVIAIGLIPLSLLFFGQVSLISFIANLIAIPFIGFVILPLCLLAALCSICYLNNTAMFLWKKAEYLLSLFWPVMHYLANLPHMQWLLTITKSWQLFFVCIAILLLVAPKGWPARWLGLYWLLPLLFRH